MFRSSTRGAAIIAAIVALAEALEMETTAEGIESLDQLELIRKLNVSHVQGYIYAKPLTLADASARLQTGLTAIAIGPETIMPAYYSMQGLQRVAGAYAGQTVLSGQGLEDIVAYLLANTRSAPALPQRP